MVKKILFILAWMFVWCIVAYVVDQNIIYLSKHPACIMAIGAVLGILCPSQYWDN